MNPNLTAPQLPKVLSASTLAGTAVVNSAGEDLGEIKEIMLDLAGGRIAYAVLSFGGFLGVGDKLFAIPWQAFQIDPENEYLILDVDRETLESAPGFDKSEWPSEADNTWLREVYRHYGYEPYWDN